MCITEYNEAETMQLFKEEFLEEGRAEGKAEATRESHLRVFKEALEMGMSREQAIKLSHITEDELRAIVL